MIAIEVDSKTPRREALVREIDRLVSMPCIEAILMPLVSYLQQPMEDQDMQRVVDLVAHDSSLTAQCLRMANSALFGHRQTISSARGAVIALGLQRMRDIVMSCCVLKLVPMDSEEQDPRSLWEHMLACAMVTRKLAKRVGASDPEQMYLAGLLHDIGLVVSLRLFPADAAEIMRRAAATGSGIVTVEEEVLGFNHCEAGYMLAERWNLIPMIRDVIGGHHTETGASEASIALVNIGDRICRINGLGYGHKELLHIDWQQDSCVARVKADCPVARNIDWDRCGSELQNYANEIKKLVTVLFRFS